jgi:hypothetical protein
LQDDARCIQSRNDYMNHVNTRRGQNAKFLTIITRDMYAYC